MNDTKFTPGPYRVGADMESICLNRGTEEDYTSNGWAKKLATVHWKQSWMSPEEAFANAKLFSASPELYEMLQIARDYVQGELEEERQAYKGYESSSNIPSLEEDLNRIDAALAKARGEV